MTIAVQLRLLVITQGTWGERIADHIEHNHPDDWEVYRWAAPRVLPLIVDDGEEFLPPSLPTAELVLALGDTAGVPQLLPDIARMCGARSVIAPIDRNESLPPGLVAQVRRWLAARGVNVVFPKPFCTLTETGYNAYPIQQTYSDPLVSAFARVYGAPRFEITVDDNRRVASVNVLRDAACGCGQHVANGLPGCQVDEAEQSAGMLHHHFPCLASMNQDADYHDTLMHISGNVLREAVKTQVAEHVTPVSYLRPHNRSEAESE